MRTHSRQKGVALIISLVTSIILALIVSYFVWHSQQIIKTQFLMQNKISAELEADSVLSHAIFDFVKHRSELANNIITTKYPGWNLYGKPFVLSSGASLSIRSEASKISLIPTDYQLIELLLRGIIEDEIEGKAIKNIEIDQVIARLKDWQDSDQFVNLNGLEGDGYSRLGLLKPRDFYIQSIDELMLIHGFKQEWLDKIRDHVSLFTLTDFNVRLSPKQLIEWLYNSDQAAVIAEQRGERDEESVLSHLKRVSPLLSQQSIENKLIQTIELEVNISLVQVKVVKKVVFSTKVALDSPYPYEIWHWES